MSSLVLGSFMIKIIANMVKDRQHLRFSMCEGLGFRLSGRCFLSAYLPTSLLKIQMGIFLTSSSFCLISPVLLVLRSKSSYMFYYTSSCSSLL